MRSGTTFTLGDADQQPLAPGGEAQHPAEAHRARAAHLSFVGASNGEIAFVAVKGFLDVRYGSRDGAACAEFSWQGHDDADEACGRGWVTLGTAGRLVGHIFIHQGDDSGLVCERD